MQPQNLVQERTHRVAIYWEMWGIVGFGEGLMSTCNNQLSARARNQPNAKEKKTTWERFQVYFDCGR